MEVLQFCSLTVILFLTFKTEQANSNPLQDDPDNSVSSQSDDDSDEDSDDASSE